MSRGTQRVEPKADICGATRKRRFRSSAAAGIALEIAKERANDETDLRARRRQEKRFYDCVYCGGWHLTSSAE